jgi:hypothetical protein
MTDTKQPEALRLADTLEHEYKFVVVERSDKNGDRITVDANIDSVILELRRLNEVNQQWEIKAATWLASPEAAQKLEGYRELAQRVNQLESLNAELVEALKVLVANGGIGSEDMFDDARAAIAKAEVTK